MRDWTVFKGDVPCKLAGEWSDRKFEDTELAGIDAAKSKLFLALKAHSVENSVGPDDVCICPKPGVLRANREFAKGELVLTPFVLLSGITSKSSTSVFDIGSAV